MFNRPRAMLERLAYVGWLTITAASLSALILSLTFAISGEGGGLFLSGAAGIVASAVFNHLGRRYLHFEKCERSLELVWPHGMPSPKPGYAERASSLRRLLDEWTEVEAQILQGKSDIWQRQAIRRQALSLLAADPQLRIEFRDELSEHPELREG